MLNYKIIASSSRDGNCVLIDDVMVNIGVSFRKVKEDLYKAKYLLITHIHRDHLNVGTVKKIYRLFPHVKILSNYEVYSFLRDEGLTIDIINPSRPYWTSQYVFRAFNCYHSVSNLWLLLATVRGRISSMQQTLVT